jgi:hypothetical protein
MTTFHSRQPHCAQRARKNINVGTFNFASQIASSICIVAFTKCEKSGATIFKSRCSRTLLFCNFRQGHALPLSFVRFLRLANGSPTNWQNSARRSRNGLEPSHKKSGEMSRPFPHICRAIAGLWQMQCHRMSTRQLARQLASWRATVTHRPCRSPRNSRCNMPRNILRDDCSQFRHHVFNHDAQ